MRMLYKTVLPSVLVCSRTSRWLGDPTGQIEVRSSPPNEFFKMAVSLAPRQIGTGGSV